MALTQLAHQLVQQHIQQYPQLLNNIAIDATCGNGNDTLFLHGLGFKELFAFDIQQQAIDKSREKIEANSIRFICDSHANMARYINGKISVIMFNLGYLPQGDKSITTETVSTLSALEQAEKVLSKHGVVSLLCYPGHPNGKLETKAIQDYLKAHQYWHSDCYEGDSTNEASPVLYLLKLL